MRQAIHRGASWAHITQVFWRVILEYNVICFNQYKRLDRHFWISSREKISNMQLLVRSIDTRIVDTSVCHSAADLKCLLASQDELPLEDIQLYNGASLLDNEAQLGELPENAAIDVIVPMLGGTYPFLTYQNW